MALSNNDKTGFKARELKSVHVDAVGLFVKFVIHKNHINKHNLYNQVSQTMIDRVMYSSKLIFYAKYVQIKSNHFYELAMPYGDIDLDLNFGSSNGLLPDGVKPLPQSMLTYHQ